MPFDHAYSRHGDIQSTRLSTSLRLWIYRGRFCQLIAVIFAMLHVAEPVQAANSGGSTTTACGPDYIGACSVDAEVASSGDVWIDTAADIAGMMVAGGYADADGDAKDNRVRIGGSDTFDVMGFYGGTSCSGNAAGNSISVEGAVTINLSSLVGGQSCNGNAVGNSVVIGGRTIIDNTLVFGGDGLNGISNSVIVRDQARVDNGALFGGMGINATGNTVTLRDQARVDNSSIFGGTAMNGDATGNTIIIRDQARVENSFIFGGASEDGHATGNRVILEGSPVLTNTAIMGGFDLDNSSAGDTLTDNVLEIRGTGLNALMVDQFALYRYLLPAGMTPGIPALTLAAFSDLTPASVTVDIMPGSNAHQAGSRFTLMRGPGLLTNYATAASVSGSQGISLKYDMLLQQIGDELMATVQRVSATEESKAPLEGRAAAIALSNQGADLVAGGALGQAQSAARRDQWSGFGAVGGSSSRYASGSHVDVDGLSMVLGASRRFDTGSGSWTAGGFVEAGRGNYDSTNTFTSGTVRGHGKSRYYGAGLMARHEFAAPAASESSASSTSLASSAPSASSLTSLSALGMRGPYIETSLRLGRISQDWSSPDLRNALGDSAAYDSSASYYGGHLGLGHVLSLGERGSADLYAKYFWTHQGGDDVQIAGDPYAFGATDSHRTRLGVRLTHAIGGQARAYVGAAWEREFDARARATAYGLDTPSPSLRGNTGLFELGVEMASNKARALSITLGLQGYTGKRQGVGGSAQIRYAF